MHAILVPGGFGERGTEGKIASVRFARERNVPFFGICLGMQCAVIEFARNVCGLANANSTEFDANAPHKVIYKLRDLMVTFTPDFEFIPGSAPERRQVPPGRPFVLPDPAQSVMAE